MRVHRIVVLFFAFAIGCTSEQSGARWADTARKIGVPKEEVATIAESAAKAHKLEVVGISKEETKDIIVVYLAESRTASGGLTVFFNRSATGWIEDTTTVSSWNRK